jgi:hypothetical protein
MWYPEWDHECPGAQSVKYDRHDTRSGNYELAVGSAGVRKHKEDGTPSSATTTLKNYRRTTRYKAVRGRMRETRTTRPDPQWNSFDMIRLLDTSGEKADPERQENGCPII